MSAEHPAKYLPLQNSTSNVKEDLIQKKSTFLVILEQNASMLKERFSSKFSIIIP